MHAIDPAPTPGTEVPSTPALHAQRSAVRRLVTGLFDCWDDGDGRGFAAHFAPGGCWRDPAGITTPQTGLADRFAQWRIWEPWSLHWVSNESVVSDDLHVEGRWLWSSASTVRHGTEAAWSGGDLILQAVFHEGRWLINDLAMSYRYCTPLSEGWLTTPMIHLDVPGGPATAGQRSTTGSCKTEPAATPTGGADDAALEALAGERDIRAVMWSFIDDQEEGRDPQMIAAHFSVDASLELAAPGRAPIDLRGRDAIADAFDQEARLETAIVRLLCSESIAVNGPRALCRWRDLCTVVRDGEARWVSHRYVVDAAVEHGTWCFRRMVRSRVLDCPYSEGWVGDAVVAQ